MFPGRRTKGLKDSATEDRFPDQSTPGSVVNDDASFKSRSLFRVIEISRSNSP